MRALLTLAGRSTLGTGTLAAPGTLDVLAAVGGVSDRCP
jgi:hypothetical protein